MNPIKQLFAASLALIALAGTSAARDGWMTDIDAAVAKAKKENKSVMVEFTGSDWCHYCKIMDKKVFSKKKFYNKATEKFVLVSIDLPRGDKKMHEKNKPVVLKYKVRGFPTAVLLDSDGKEFHRFSAAQFQTVSSYLKHLDDALEKKDLD